MTIPTNRPCVRQDNENRVYRTEKEKWEAIIDEIKEERGFHELPIILYTNRDLNKKEEIHLKRLTQSSVVSSGRS